MDWPNGARSTLPRCKPTTRPRRWSRHEVLFAGFGRNLFGRGVFADRIVWKRRLGLTRIGGIHGTADRKRTAGSRRNGLGIPRGA